MKAEDFSKLKEPFAPEDLDWRLQSCGKKKNEFWGIALAYITSRAVQDRLDEVCGPDGWQVSVRREGEAYLATMSIRVEHSDGSIEWISRTDGADATDIEPIKGGISGSIKRCAVLFGVGRYLYNLKDNFAVITQNGHYSGKTKEGEWFKWDAPKLPTWALPKGTLSPEAERERQKELKSEQKKPVSPEVQKAIDKLQKYISEGKLNKDWVGKAQMYINTANLEGINKVIQYIEEQMKAEEAFDEKTGE